MLFIFVILSDKKENKEDLNKDAEVKKEVEEEKPVKEEVIE